LKGRAGTAVR